MKIIKEDHFSEPIEDYAMHSSPEEIKQPEVLAFDLKPIVKEQPRVKARNNLASDFDPEAALSESQTKVFNKIQFQDNYMW